jgi:hypothetical protein
LEPPGCHRSCDSVLHIFGVSCGRWALEKHEFLPKMVGDAGCWFGFVLAALAFLVMVVAAGKVDGKITDVSYRTYRVLIHGIFVMMVVFFLFGDRIVWINCLSGFAWRAWLLLYCLPAWFSALRITAAN